MHDNIDRITIYMETKSSVRMASDSFSSMDTDDAQGLHNEWQETTHSCLMPCFLV